MSSTKEQFLSTLKQTEISDWDEIWVIRLTGFFLARFFNKFGIHPNTVTIWSMFLGAGSAYFFAHGSIYYEGLTGLIYNVIGIALLFFADILDNTDGQLARLSGKKSKIGRILDGVAGFIWYIPIYVVLVWRIYTHHSMEFGWFGIQDNETISAIYGILVFILTLYAGFACCGGQQRISDYYVQAHLYFMRASNGYELDNSKEQQEAYDKLPKDASWIERQFMKLYVDYTKKQERKTPKFQNLLTKLKEKYGDLNAVPAEVLEELRQESLKVMKHDYSAFKQRALALALFVVVDFPLGLMLFEIIILGYATYWLVSHHEAFCEKIANKL